MDYRDAIVFEKFHVQNVFLPQKKHLRFEERFRKAVFSCWISVDGRPDRRNKAAFSNSPECCGRGLRSRFNELQCLFSHELNLAKVQKVSLSNLRLCDSEKNRVKGNHISRNYFFKLTYKTRMLQILFKHMISNTASSN